MRQLLRWVMRIQGFDYTVQYRPGATNIADSLSRLSVKTSSPTSFDEATEVYAPRYIELQGSAKSSLPQYCCKFLLILFEGTS